MPITRYKLDKNPDGSMQAPPYIKDGGYYYHNDDHTMFGWYNYYNQFETPDKIIEVTKNELGDILVERSVDSPFTDPITNEILTEGQIRDQANTWYETKFTENFVIPPSPTMNEIVSLQEKKIMAAFDYMQRRLEKAVVLVPIASEATNCPFGCDTETQDNIIGINTAIARSIPIPNPTVWAPKGYPIPVQVTHEELAYIGGSILAKKNEYYAVYFLHKATIMMTSDYETIGKYDFTTGYE